MGALLVELPDGTRFAVGTGFSDAERRNPPPKGSVITFRYQELSDGGVPRFPSYVGVRDDGLLPPAKVHVVAPAPVAPAAAGPASAVGGSAGPRRRFQLVDGDSSKFWEIEVRDREHTVRYGRVGTQGQAKTKQFADAAAAQAAADDLIAQKVDKGYVET